MCQDLTELRQSSNKVASHCNKFLSCWSKIYVQKGDTVKNTHMFNKVEQNRQSLGFQWVRISGTVKLYGKYYICRGQYVIGCPSGHQPWYRTRLTSAGCCPASRTTLVATRFRVAVICPIIQVPHCIRVFFYFVWFVFINHIFQFYYELCTYCNILDIYLS